MANDNTQKDFLEYDDNGKPKMPAAINILTILTFIGCGIALLFTALTPVLMDFFNKAMESAKDKDLSAKELQQMEEGRKAMELYHQYQLPIIVITLVGVALCIWGAIEMRKLKKQGYLIYVIGELAPIIASGLIMGFSSQMNSVWSMLMGFGIPVLFVILYTVNKKYLVK